MEEKETNENNIESEYQYEIKQMKYKCILATIITTLLAVVISVGITYYITIGKKYDDLYKASSKVAESEGEITSAMESLDDISSVLAVMAQVIDSEYIGEIDKKEIIEQTVKGFIKGIGDEYSEYFTEDEWEDYLANLGNYVGIGVYLSTDENDNVVIVGVIKDSPAEEAGLKENDIIVSVDGISAVGLDVEEISSMVKGEENTPVQLSVYRGEEEKEITLIRKAIKVYHVEYNMLEDTIGYVSLITFDEGCADEIRNSYLDLKNKGAKKIILDLRNNTGGLVNECLEIADMMLPKDAIELITVDAKENKEYSKCH